MADQGQEGTDKISAQPYSSPEPEEEPIEEPTEEETPTEETPSPNPWQMAKEEVRNWLQSATREEKVAALLEHAPNPDDVVFMNLDYGDKTTSLAEERRRLNEDRETMNRIINQLAGQQQPRQETDFSATPPPPAPAPTPSPYQEDPYAPAPDPRYQQLEQNTQSLAKELKALKEQQDRRDALEGMRRIKEEMSQLSVENSWFTEADHDSLFAEMQQSGITSARIAFRNKFWDRRPQGGPPPTQQTPPARVPMPGAKSPKKIPPMPTNPDEYAEWVAKYHMQEETIG